MFRRPLRRTASDRIASQRSRCRRGGRRCRDPGSRFHTEDCRPSRHRQVTMMSIHQWPAHRPPVSGHEVCCAKPWFLQRISRKSIRAAGRPAVNRGRRRRHPAHSEEPRSTHRCHRCPPCHRCLLARQRRRDRHRHPDSELRFQRSPCRGPRSRRRPHKPSSARIASWRPDPRPVDRKCTDPSLR
jgi:hypothetical protein